ncbi:hypothetical protein OUZ56_010464 [Daphnia magna]|uniref:Uncharacterized protein n=1 Tax=Daphnia magna TaxID=35525 RepID=A0ABR0AIR0_9CRUS|nr:hypothetical protein OUZ56_010460 [Daphnia magna]KAK4024968.1 hypothetical protein OUZ56_010462 [Daphnia magna]KAK4024970.1 hypothetical protein OUZ56_010464 [Daphnia magna]
MDGVSSDSACSNDQPASKSFQLDKARPKELRSLICPEAVGVQTVNDRSRLYVTLPYTSATPFTPKVNGSR